MDKSKKQQEASSIAQRQRPFTQERENNQQYKDNNGGHPYGLWGRERDMKT